MIIILSPANSQTEAEATTGECVQACRLLRQNASAVQRGNQNGGYQPNARRHSSSGCQSHERFIIGVHQAIKTPEAGEGANVRTPGPIQDKLTGYSGDRPR